MNILLSNDDGIGAPGLRALANKLKQLGNITIVAPDSERSAVSSAITLLNPLTVKEEDYPISDIKAYSTSGNPADCVKIGLESICKERPDLVVTGINKGPNMCCDIMYSGTVGAAIEGAFAGILSAAVSLNSYDTKADYEQAAEYGLKIIKILLENNVSHERVYNINVPDIDGKDIKGVKVTKVGTINYVGGYEERINPYGKKYYWACGKPVIIDKSSLSDVVAVKEGWVSLTPLKPDFTDFETIKKLNELF